MMFPTISSNDCQKLLFSILKTPNDGHSLSPPPFYYLDHREPVTIYSNFYYVIFNIEGQLDTTSFLSFSQLEHHKFYSLHSMDCALFHYSLEYKQNQHSFLNLSISNNFVFKYSTFKVHI